MTCSRRAFLKDAVGGTLASVLPLSAFTLLTTDQAKAAIADAKVRWAFLVDTTKCVGCGLCVKECHGIVVNGSACILTNSGKGIPTDFIAIQQTWENRQKHGKGFLPKLKGPHD